MDSTARTLEPEPETDTRTTAEVIADMLRENTGKHFLDSGGAYGRHWERNQDRDFSAEPYAEVEFNVYKHSEPPQAETLVTVNLYHWLVERLDYESELTAAYEKFCDDREASYDLPGQRELESYLVDCYERNQDAEIFYDALGVDDDWRDSGEYVPAGIYGDGSPIVINSYNEENTLSQTIQFLFWEMNGSEYYALSIHGGCDVRGGYGDVKIFSGGGYSDLALFDMRQAYLRCDTCDASWYSDDAGYHWYPSNREAEMPEHAYQLPEEREAEYLEAAEADAINPLLIPADRLVISEAGHAYCPECRVGKLGA